MAETETDLTLPQRLGLALDRGRLPAGGPAEAAERAIERLERPVRLVLMGLPGAGRTSVMNLLAGEEVVPSGLRLPTLLFSRCTDAGEQTVCVLADGSTTVLAGRNLDEAAGLNAAQVTLEMNLPALSVISLMELVVGATDTEQRRAMSWAAKRADIAIWCSTTFVPKEQMLWEAMADATKDNAFLLITKTDLLGSKDATTALVKRIEARAGDQFRKVLAVSTDQARLAFGGNGTVDRQAFQASGASGLIGTIKNRVESARRADEDLAEMLLIKYDGVAPKAKKPSASLSSAAAPPKPTPTVEAENPPRQNAMGGPQVYVPPSPPPATMGSDSRPQTNKPIKADPSGARRVAIPIAPAVAALDAAPPRAVRQKPLLLVPKEQAKDISAARSSAAAVAPIREVLSAEERAMIEQAVTEMLARAGTIAEILLSTEKVPTERVIDQGRDATEKLSDILETGKSRQIRRIKGDLDEIQDLLTLMKLERGPTPAEDTLTLMLQIRRDLETLLAA